MFNGVCFHCSVLEHLTHLYDLEPGTVHASWDWIHKTGLLDKKLTNQDMFAWLRNLIDVCLEVELEEPDQLFRHQVCELKEESIQEYFAHARSNLVSAVCWRIM